MGKYIKLFEFIFSKLKDIDPWDVAEKSKLIKEMTVEVKWIWKIEEAEGEDTFHKCYL